MKHPLLSYNNSLPAEASFKLLKYGSLAHQPWYLKSLKTNCYLLEREEYMVLIPLKRNLFYEKAILPPGIQRLDPISLKTNNKLNSTLLEEIVKLIPCGYVSWSYNIDNLPSTIKKIQRNNYILHLLPDYNQLRKNYNSSLKNSLNKNKHTVHTGMSPLEFANFYNKFSNKRIPELYKNTKILSNIISACIENNAGEIKYVIGMQQQPIALAFFSNFNGRIVYQYSCSTDEGRSVDAMHAILDHAIQSYCGQDISLDFEGSMIPGLAFFFQSFGAKLEYYFLYSWNINWICKLSTGLRTCLKSLRRN